MVLDMDYRILVSVRYHILPLISRCRVCNELNRSVLRVYQYHQFISVVCPGYMYDPSMDGWFQSLSATKRSSYVDHVYGCVLQKIKLDALQAAIHPLCASYLLFSVCHMLICVSSTQDICLSIHLPANMYKSCSGYCYCKCFQVRSSGRVSTQVKISHMNHNMQDAA